MNKVLTSLLLSSSLLIPSSSPASMPSTHSLVDRVEASIIKVEVGDLEANHGICTGFVTSSSKGEALTAAHCLPEEGEPIYVDGKASEVIRKNDLFGLVRIDPMSKPPLNIRTSKVEVAEGVWSFGYAWGKLTVFGRHVALFMGGDVAMDGPLAPGMSGGPTVDAKGEVIGINQASNEVIGITCSSREILEFLEKR